MDKSNFEKLIKRKAEKLVDTSYKDLIRQVDHFFKHNHDLKQNSGYYRFTDALEVVFRANEKELVKQAEEKIFSETFEKIDQLKYILEQNQE